MNISAPLINYNVSAQATAARAGSGSAVTLLQSTATLVPSDANQVYSTHYILAGASTVATLNLSTGDATGDAWTAPVRQVETATAAGTITTAGDATATVTAAGMTGSPKAVTFAVALNDTASDWAEKCRTALAADTDVSGMFDVSGTGTSIILTRKPLATYALGSTTIEMAYSNDATLNIALADSTSAGITEAATSANTTTAVVGDGAYIANDDVDYEGVALDSPTDIYAVLIEHSSDDGAGTQQLDYTIGTEYSGRMTVSSTKSAAVLMSYPDTTSILDTLSLTGTSNTGLVKVTVIAKV
jgi:hypothetical protein